MATAQTATADAGAQSVMDHLKFHKAFVDASEADLDRIEGYMDMVETELHAFSDPYERSIALAFKLVLQDELDPWAIDLLEFSERYMERVKLRAEVDLSTAGRILLLAWSVLRVQVEDLLLRAEPAPEPEPEPLPWDMLPMWEPEDAELRDFTTAVLDAPEPPIQESVFHEGERRVTLFELVEALDEARDEAQRRQVLGEKRREEREALKQAYQDAGKNRVHKEDLESEIAQIWARIQNAPGVVPLGALHDGTRWGFLTAFVSLLFLSRNGKVRLQQERFPHGPITAEIVPEDERSESSDPRVDEAMAAATNGDGTGEPADDTADAVTTVATNGTTQSEETGSQ